MVRRLWWRIREPRVEKMIYFIVYVGVVILAAATSLNPPMTISDPLGPVLTVTWVVLWVFSALIGACSVFSGWWAAERIGLWLGLLGVLIYSSVVVALHVTGGGSRLAQLTVLWIAAAFYGVRLHRIWGHDFEPRHQP